MEILKQIFPFSLNGVEFLIFYGILFIIFILIAYRNYSKKEQAQLQNDIDQLELSNAYDLAYLRGGEQTFYELIISELIEENRLIENNQEFIVNATVKIDNPISVYLATLNKKTINLEQLFEIAKTELGKTKEKFQPFLDAGDSRILNANLLLLGCFELVGAVRLIQGINNDKPIGFLLVLMLIGIISLFVMHGWPIRKSMAEKYFNFNWEDMHVSITPFQNRILKYGFSAICVGTALYSLYPLFSSMNFHRKNSHNSTYDSWGSGCSSNSCGSSCSSSCGGGGCGGCGD